MSKSWKTLGVMAGLVVASALAVGFSFAPWVQSAREEMVSQARILGQYQELMKRKESLESEWKLKQQSLSPGLPAEDVLNAWQNGLMAYAQSQAVVLDKLEPVSQKGDEVSLFLSFRGDMKKLLRFVYHLWESESMVRLMTFSMRQEEGALTFSFEMMLAKRVAV